MPVRRLPESPRDCGCPILLAAAAVTSGALLVPGASAGTIRHDRLDSQYTGLASAYPSVGALLFDYDPNNSTFSGLGSGTLITPEWVLTAGHVSSALPGDTLDFFIDGRRVPVVQRVTHPSWNGQITHGYDIGLVRLATPVTTVTPAVRFAGVNFEEFDTTGTYVGFGNTGTGLTGQVTGSAGVKRAGENFTDLGTNNDEGLLHFVGSDFDDPPTGGGYTNDGFNYPGTDLAPLSMEYSIAQGDSGGGLFVDLGSGPLLAGVNSFLTVAFPFGDLSANADYGDLMFATRVAEFNGFINQTVPEPATLSLIAGLGLSLLARPRARRGARVN